METVKIKFRYFMEEMGYLGLAANHVDLKWNDFFNKAVQEQIDWVMDPEEEEEVKRMAGHFWQEAHLDDEELSFENSIFLSLDFPIEKLESLHKAAEKLRVSLDTFISDAVWDKVENIEIGLQCKIFEKGFVLKKEDFVLWEEVLNENEK